MIAIVRDGAAFHPAAAPVRRGPEHLREFLRIAAHQVGSHAQRSIGQVNYAIGLEPAYAIVCLGGRPTVAIVVAPVQPVARRLIFVEVAVIVMIDDHNQAAIIQPTQAGRNQALVTGCQISAVNLAVLEPGRAIVVAGEERQNLILQRPMRVDIAVDQQVTARRQDDDIRIFSESPRAAPDVESFVGEGSCMNQQGGLLVYETMKGNETNDSNCSAPARRQATGARH